MDLEAAAQAAGLGVHAPDAAAHVRTVDWVSDRDSRALYEAFKGKPIPGLRACRDCLSQC